MGRTPAAPAGPDGSPPGAAWGVFAVLLGTLVVPLEFGGQRRFPVHYRAFPSGDSADPVDRHQLHPDDIEPDAGVRPRGRHARLSARVRDGVRLERGRLRAVRQRAVLPLAAGGAGAAGNRRGAGAELRAGADHRALSGPAAGPRAWHLHARVRTGRRARPGGGRRAGGAVRMERGVLGAGADRRAGRAGRARVARRAAPGGPGAIRRCRRGAAGAGDRGAAAGAQPVPHPGLRADRRGGRRGCLCRIRAARDPGRAPDSQPASVPRPRASRWSISAMCW